MPPGSRSGATRSAAATRQPADRERRVGRHRDVDDDRRPDGGLGRVGGAGLAVPPADRAAVARAARGRERGRARLDHHAEVDLRRRAARALDEDLPAPRQHERVGRSVEQGEPGDDDRRPGPAATERREVQPDRHGVRRERDRVQPVRHVVVGRRHRVGDTGLAGAPRTGQDGERAAVARRRVAALDLARIRAAPVERLVDAVADRRERQEPPADDPVGDLEPASDVELDRPAIGQLDPVAGERLAGREDPADRHPGRAIAARVAPAVREVRDDEMARALARRRSIASSRSSRIQRRPAVRVPRSKGRPRKTEGPSGSRATAGR